MNRLITVCGLPSGGTSMIAGVLHYLGVDMGRIRSYEECVQWAEERRRAGDGGVRPYQHFEDLDLNEQINHFVSGDYEAIFNVFDKYVVDRLAQANGKPVGCKAIPVSFIALDSRLSKDMPIEVIRIDRDPDEHIRSELRYQPTLDLGRCASFGQMRACLAILVRRAYCRLWFKYEDAKRSPRELVEAINETLELDATSEQIESAVACVESRGRSVQHE